MNNQKKVGVICFNERGLVPFVENYIQALERHDIDYECIFWDRYTNAETEKKGNIYTLHAVCKPGGSKLSKVLPMFKYKWIVERIIKKEKYTHLIILTTQPGFLLHGLLCKNYSGKYIFDYRDYTYERFEYYKNIVNDLIDQSYFTAVSSKGFLRFLEPHQKMYFCHNVTNLESIVSNKIDIKGKDNITIGFVGGVRYFSENAKFLQSLANINRYTLTYVGRQNIDCDLKSYCKEKKILNTIFKGSFDNNEKPRIYQTIDMINSIYGNQSLEVTTALPNRLYDALIYKKPIITSAGTYLGKIVVENKVGISVDLDKDDIHAVIEDYVNNFDANIFNENAERLLKQVLDEQQMYINKIEEFVNLED
ncbi:hypothetical protein [Phascolarctobacterium sp.]|uniref:hypothetical protein n=1 Tax=Phascolarctobacterium sp. TaxID=2049039 RepID=UPI00386ADFB7